MWLGNWDCHNLVEFDPDSEEFTFHVAPVSMERTRGVAVDDAGRIWVVSTSNNRVGRYDPADDSWVTSGTCDQPMGVGITGRSTVWTPCWDANVDYFDSEGARLGSVRSGGSNPYSYSDMTGFQLRTFTARLGTWTATYDCGREVCTFDTVEWSSDEPVFTSVQLRARTSLDNESYTAWEGPFTVSPGDLEALAPGRYIQVEVTLRTTDDEITPVVDSIVVNWQRP